MSRAQMPDTAGPAEPVERAYVAKALAELVEADRLLPGSDRVAWSGQPMAGIVLMKGACGPAEESGAPALSGTDGDALLKALEALGLGAETWFAALTRPVSADDEAEVSARARLIVEAVDPWLVIALDEIAADDVSRAFGIRRPPFGTSVDICGRQLLAVGGFESALGDERRKRVVWGHLRGVRLREPVW